MSRSYYDVLGVSRWARAGRIKAAFRNEIKVMENVRAQEGEFSPENAARSKETLDQHFEEVKEAYDVLSDAQRRKQYDEFLNRAQPPSEAEKRSELARARRARYIA